jgi:hypothetical protein
VHLIRAGEQVFLIGSTDQAVTLLGQISPQAGAQGITQPAAGELSFDEQLALASQKNEEKPGIH